MGVGQFEGVFPSLFPASVHEVDVEQSVGMEQGFALKLLHKSLEEVIGGRVGVIFIHGVAVGLLVNYWVLRARKFKPRHTPLSEIFVSVKFSTLINRCQQPNLEEKKMPAQSDEWIEPAGLCVFFEDISGITVPSNALREERGRREGGEREGVDMTIRATA